MASIRQWKVINGWKYEVKDDSNLGKLMNIKKTETIFIDSGFVFDGASISKPFWAILSPTGIFLVQGLIHDYAYRNDYLKILDQNDLPTKWRKQKGRDFWDKVFREVGKDVNGLNVINYLAWFLLYLFGCCAWNNRKKQRREAMLKKRKEAKT